jgi:predicted Rossmann fold nucleotide-binding protein DprA/Smf involved in DNA uptake
MAVGVSAGGLDQPLPRFAAPLRERLSAAAAGEVGRHLRAPGAAPVEEAADVLAVSKFSFNNQYIKNQPSGAEITASLSPELDKDYEILLDAPRTEPVSVESLICQTGLPSQTIASMLLILELEGRVTLHADRHTVHLTP